jgi:hypothetical protein
MATRMQQRRGTAAQWVAADPILAAGEIGVETDTNQFKIGDGVNHWADLSYFKNLDDLGGTLDDYIPLTQKAADNGVATLDANGYVPVDQLGNLVGDAPEILNTLGELATAIDDAGGLVSSKITTAIAAEAIARDNAIDEAVGVVQGAIDDEVAARIGAINAEATARDQAISTAVGDHSNDTTNVHGIADTSVLVTTTTAQGYVSDHNSDTTNVHGIADTSALATKSGTEILLNKTIDGLENTFVNIPVSAIANVTATAEELNILDGVTVSAAKINYLSGLTDNVQTQLDAKASLSSPTFTGDLSANNISISGNLTVGGTTTTVNAQDLVVSDPLIYIGEDNTGDVVDLGIVSSFTQANAYQHAGIVRDATDGVWKLFSSVEDEPTTTVNFSQAVYDTLKVGGIEYADGVQVKQGVPSITTINQQSNTYTTVLSDRDKLIEINSGSPTQLIINSDLSVNYPIGTSFDILQTGNGQVTITAGSNVTINATPGLKLRTQWSSATLFKRAANTWVAFGDLSA